MEPLAPPITSAAAPRLSRRALISGLAALTAGPAVGGLAGCSGAVIGGSTGGGGGGNSKLTYLYLGEASGAAAVKAQYDGFTKAHPNIQFSAQGLASQTWAAFANAVATRIAGGQSPDVIDIATEGLGIFRSKKLVTDLDPYVAKNKGDVDSYYADISPTLKKWHDKFGNPGGVTYYIPGGYNTVCLYCNTDIFAKAGVDLPGEEDWTWDDFTAAAATIKAKTGAFMLPFGSAQFTDIMPWLLTNGASTLNADWTAPVIGSDAAVETAEFCREMVAKGYSPKPGGTFDAATAMSQGKLAALAGGRWPTIDILRLKLVDKVQIVKVPKKVTNGSPIGWDAFPILSSSKLKDEAWQFLLYLMTKESGEAFAKVGGTNIPARVSIASSNTFLDGAPKGSDLLYKAAEYATPVPSPNKGAESQQAVEQAWLKIVSGNAQAAPTLSKLSDQLAALL